MGNFRKKFLDILDDHSYGIICAPTDPDLALNVLTEYLLGEDWYSCSGGGAHQVNTEIVYDILMKYSRKFRKDIRKRRKQHDI